jgi:hypothetical protein
MKKYNKPTIEALALETIDVIAASGMEDAVTALEGKIDSSVNVQQIAENIVDMGQKWSW